MRVGNRTVGTRLRIVLEPDIAIGPGKADILEAIRETGSIAAAGRRMGMSYKRAWLLVETMNACFKSPLVEASRGGRARGCYSDARRRTGSRLLSPDGGAHRQGHRQGVGELRSLLRDASPQKAVEARERYRYV